MRQEFIQTDITVIGGGLSGVCAAIAAARLGRTVSLVQNRPVLGGNSSSEVRVWVSGATASGGINRYARETGIIGELIDENQFRNPDGNPYLWDALIRDFVLAERNIQLFLNTDVHEVEAEGGLACRTVRSVTGWMMGSERRITFTSSYFLDCTGDGLIGFMAGAQYRIGREAKAEFQEDWAPEVSDSITLGSTLLFYTKDVGQPVTYIAPNFAKDISQTSIPANRIIRSGDSGCYYWWIEWGGLLDTVHDNERIRDELWSVIYGIWDYIKNSGRFHADNLTLEWVGSVPGKREFRRFIGDYTLTQNDIVQQAPFRDIIGFGGWSIDLHPPEGMYSTKGGSKHLHPDGIYHIPFRCLYSINVSNLLFAGRNISATHVAFGSTRVMATCAVMGEAAGTAAALCSMLNVTPKTLYEKEMGTLQQQLLKQDASIIGLRSTDQQDLVRIGHIDASSSLTRIAVEHAQTTYRLDSDVGMLFPVNPRVDHVELLLDAEAPCKLSVELWETGRPENYVPHTRMGSKTKEIGQGAAQWIRFELPWEPAAAQNAFLIVNANESVRLYVSDRPYSGLLSFVKTDTPVEAKKLEDRELDQPVVAWNMRKLNRQSFCFRLSPDTNAYRPDVIADGYVRPYGGPHLWVSQPLDGAKSMNCAEWVQIEWQQPVRIRELHLTFNNDVNEYLVNLHFLRTPYPVMPELIKAYRIEARVDGEWEVVVHETDNRKRKRIHVLASEIVSDCIKVSMYGTHGSSCAELIEVRAYGGNRDER